MPGHGGRGGEVLAHPWRRPGGRQGSQHAHPLGRVAAERQGQPEIHLRRAELGRRRQRGAIRVLRRQVLPAQVARDAEVVQRGSIGRLHGQHGPELRRGAVGIGPQQDPAEADAGRERRRVGRQRLPEARLGPIALAERGERLPLHRQRRRVAGVDGEGLGAGMERPRGIAGGQRRPGHRKVRVARGRSRRDRASTEEEHQQQRRQPGARGHGPVSLGSEWGKEIEPAKECPLARR
jgi:hypothetical protein